MKKLKITRNAIDLFSGCGGLTRGLRDAGFNVVACAEIRPEARQVYLANHPGHRIYDDIRKMEAKEVLANAGLAKGELDLLAACPPCQGFSSIRTRNGVVAKDDRNELIFEVLRLAQGILPRCVLIENVPRLLKDYRLDAFKEELTKLNYVFSEGILDAQDFDVPQRRKRMILIGSRIGELGLPDKSKEKVSVRDVIFGLPAPDSAHRKPLHRLRQKFTPKVLARISAVKKNRSDLPEKYVLECHKRYPEGFKDVYGRMDWDDVSPTITRSSHNPSKGRFIHPSDNRGLTIYESMLLQGFPKSYIFPVSLGIGKISSMIGEAFPPPLAFAQANHIREKLDAYDKRKSKNSSRNR